jgi:hypothetical protein
MQFYESNSYDATKTFRYDVSTDDGGQLIKRRKLETSARQGFRCTLKWIRTFRAFLHETRILHKICVVRPKFCRTTKIGNISILRQPTKIRVGWQKNCVDRPGTDVMIFKNIFAENFGENFGVFYLKLS